MERWRVEDLMELEREVQRCGPVFTVRRVLQRLERGEVTPLEAALIIRVQRTFSACNCRKAVL